MAELANGEAEGPPSGSHETVVVAPQQGTPPPSEFRRFTREYENQRNDNTYLSGSKETARFEFSSGSEGRGAEFDELAWLILKLKETITHQTSIIEKQNSTIENIRADLAGIKEEWVLSLDHAWIYSIAGS